MQDATKERREIKASYRDALQGRQGYEDLVEEIKTLKARKKQVEIAVDAELGQSEKLELLSKHITDDKQLLSDLAFNSLIKGETVKVNGPFNTEYEPVFNVQFKKKK
jgi:hypothetical protein